MTSVLVIYLYLTSIGERNVYCQRLKNYDWYKVEGLKDERRVLLNCGPGLRNINIEPSKLDPEIILTLESRLLDITTQYDKTIAESLYPKVSKTPTDKN